MKGHANWSGRVPRTTEEAFGPGEYMQAERASKPDTGWHMLIAICLAIMVGLSFGWPL